MEDPFAKYGDYQHASMFAGEYRRDNQGGNDASLVLACWAAMASDMKALVQGGNFLPSHNPAKENEQ